MKRKWFLGFLVFVCAAVLGRPIFAGSTRQASVTSITGKVEWLKAGSSEWNAAQVNQKLESGDKVKTGEASEATLTLDEGSQIQLMPGTEFSVQSLTKASDEQMETVLAVLKGKVRSQVTPLKPGSTFEIETPILVASVLGTTLNVGVNPDGSISVTDEDGNVVASGSGEPAFNAALDNGDEAQVTKNPDGSITVKSVNGTFTVKGPDGGEQELNPGDEVVFTPDGAATYVPAGPGDTTDAPGTDPRFEPPASTDTPSTSLTTPPSETGD